MTNDAIANAETDVHASPDRVWSALTDPEQIAAYMGGSRVETTWGGRYADHLER